MRKLILPALLFLITGQAFGQQFDLSPQQLSIGVGSGYTLIQNQYSDGSHSYKHWDDYLNPLHLNIQFTWKNRKWVAPFLNAQVAFYNRIIGDIVDHPTMFNLTGGVRFLPTNDQRFKVVAFGGGILFDKTYGFVLGPKVGYRIFRWFEIELQLAYARTYGKGFVDYQMFDGKLLFVFTFN